MISNLRVLRRVLRQLIHRPFLFFGFSLARVKPFEAAIRRLELQRDEIYFVQVGAHNGVTSDPFARFVSANNWNCILVEPQKRFTDLLKTIYSDRENIRCLDCAVGETDGSKTMFRVGDGAEGLPHWATQLASFRYEVIAGHEDRIPGLKDLIIEEQVPVRSLTSLVLESRFPRLDLLAIDVEGYDFEVVKQIDSLPWLPQMIYYEHGHLSHEDYAESLQFLQTRGYRTQKVNDGDTFAERAANKS